MIENKIRAIYIRVSTDKQEELSPDAQKRLLLDYANAHNIHVKRYESGEIKNIKHETIVELAKILKCSPEYLIGWQDELYPQTINN